MGLPHIISVTTANVHDKRAAIEMFKLGKIEEDISLPYSNMRSCVQ